jgi:hypothetical protein
MNGYPPPMGMGMPGRPPPMVQPVWKAYKDPTGQKEYYQNMVTQEVTWKKPDELMTNEDASRAASTMN